VWRGLFGAGSFRVLLIAFAVHRAVNDVANAPFGVRLIGIDRNAGRLLDAVQYLRWAGLRLIHAGHFLTSFFGWWVDRISALQKQLENCSRFHVGKLMKGAVSLEHSQQGLEIGVGHVLP
jgi:hypothetical protein